MEIFLVSPFFLSLLTLAQAYEEQKEEEEDPSSYVQGITVLGLLVLLIVLYRLLNAKREETREIAWKMLSGTISIFAGVVIYTVLDEGYKQLDEKIENKNAPDDSYKMEVWLARLWVIVLYAFFVCSVSVKACIGQGKEYRMDIVKGGHRHTWRDYLFARLRDCSTAETSSTNERFESMLEAAGEILLAEEKHKIDQEGNELDAGKSSYKSTICSITGSLFWAHALGFAGIDGWNMSQQQWCCLDDLNSEEKCKKHLPFADQIWWSFTLIMEQVGMYYVMFRVVGIFWSYVKVRFIEAKHFHLVKWEDGIKKRLTKRTEGSTDDDSWQWQEWTQEEEEEGKDEDCDNMEDMVVAFKKEPAGEGKVCYVEIRREGATEVCPWPRRGQTITTPTTPLVETPDFIPSFDSPRLCECTYKAGEDDNGLPVYAVPVYDEIIELWDEFRKDGENDYFAMSTSFLLLQTLRLALTGTLPIKNEDEEVWKHSLQDSSKLAAFTLFCFLCAYKAYAVFVKAKKINFLQEASRMVKCMQYLGDIFLGVCVSVFFYYLFASKNTTKPPKDFDLNWVIMSCLSALLFMVISGAFPNLSWSCLAGLNVTERQGGTFARAVDILVNVFLLSASWSAMFASKWMLAHSRWSRGAKGKLVEGLLTINVAIWVTGVVFLSIWLVDLLLVCAPSCVFRLHETHEGAFAKINTSLGLLIGFVWESEFDKAVEHIADRIHDDTHKIMFKIGAGLGVLFFLLPVWFNSIIPMSEEHGYKFGIVFRRMHARFQSIHDEVVRGHKGRARSKQHKRHFASHKEHIKEIMKILKRMMIDDTESGQVTIQSGPTSSVNSAAPTAARATFSKIACPCIRAGLLRICCICRCRLGPRSHPPGAAAPAANPVVAAPAGKPGAAAPTAKPPAARFQSIYEEVVEERKGRAQSEQHKSYFATYNKEINEIIKILQRMSTDDTTSAQVTVQSDPASSATAASYAAAATAALATFAKVPCPSRSRPPGAAALAAKPAIAKPGATAARVSFLHSGPSS